MGWITKWAIGDSRPVQLALLSLLFAVLAAGGSRTPESDVTRPGASPDIGLPHGRSSFDLSPYPWAFLRDGLEVKAEEEGAAVILVGDILLGRGVALEAEPWGDVGRWLNTADITLGNLEGVLLSEAGREIRPQTGNGPILLAADPIKAFPMGQAGLDVLSLANNHALDYGSNGLAETGAALVEAGMTPLGMISEEEIIRPIVREINGVRIAFLAFNAVTDPGLSWKCPTADSCWLRPAVWESAAGVKAISDARAAADAVIVSVHWGFEYQINPDPYQESTAQRMLAAGADLVVGHHPHVAQPVEVSGKRAAAYSLGNFVFDQGQGDTGSGLALKALFDADGLRALQVLPIKAGPRPRLMALEEARQLLERVLPKPARIAFECDRSACAEVEVTLPVKTGIFYAGQIDLTGDGLAETVRREGNKIIIYEEGLAAWRSPAAWRVVDAALGDPNDDGRYEIMLAIWREDEAGYERSQPYIVGYRGGEYRLLWGGRPVADPIQELAIDDLDGDGGDELVVIEELADGSSQAVSVWRWTGWTFTLIWRSDYGRYRDLVLEAGDGGLRLVVGSRQLGAGG